MAMIKTLDLMALLVIQDWGNGHLAIKCQCKNRASRNIQAELGFSNLS